MRQLPSALKSGERSMLWWLPSKRTCPKKGGITCSVTAEARNSQRLVFAARAKLSKTPQLLAK